MWKPGKMKLNYFGGFSDIKHFMAWINKLLDDVDTFAVTQGI